MGLDRRSFIGGLLGGVAVGALGTVGARMIVQSMPYPASTGGIPAPSVFSVEGAWTWFNDPRAIAVGDGVVLGAISMVGDLLAYDLQGTSGTDLRGSLFQVDDHANPSFLRRSSDNRILAFASAHNGAGLYTYLSSNPNDVSAFGAETDIDSSVGRSGYSYTNPVQLTGEANSPINLHFRAADGSSVNQYYYTRSTDQGATWSSATKLLSNTGDNAQFPPYVKIVRLSATKYGIFCTDGHPDFTATNSIYYFEYESNAFKKIDGTALTLPITPATHLSKVYDGTTNRAWIWDCAADGSGRPVCVYVVFNSASDFRYRRAAWNGSSWDDAEICTAGGPLYPDQPHYAGGIAIDPDDVNTVFASREIDGIHKLFRYVFSGGSWSGTQITANERAIRPYVIRNRPSEPRLLYLSGDYSTYTDYETSIKLMDSDVAAATDSTDPNHASVILHVRGDDPVDRSPVGRTLTYGANVGRNGSRTSLPGTTSSGGDGLVTAPDATDLDFSGDFTIEILGAEIDAPTASNILLSHWRAAAGGRSWQCAYEGALSPDQLGIYLSTDGTANTFIGGNFTPSGQHDFCFERSGSTVRVYADGAMIAKATFAGGLRNSPSRLVIGRAEDSIGGFGATSCWDGRFKEMRITTGVARYANDAGYTVPTRPLPTS
jgi:hypothetical protein